MKATRTNRRPVVRSGFTLLELLIVLGIIVAIAAMVAPNLLSSRTDANNDIARATIKNIEDALKRQALKNNGIFKSGTGSEMISQLAEPWEDSMGKEQKPLLEEVPLDPWGKEYQYSFSDGDLKPKIWSCGVDGVDDGGGNSTDDVSNVRRDVQ